MDRVGRADYARSLNATVPSEVTRSSRTCDAASTNSASKPATADCASRQRSTNSVQQSDLSTRQQAAQERPSIAQRNSAVVEHFMESEVGVSSTFTIDLLVVVSTMSADSEERAAT